MAKLTKALPKSLKNTVALIPLVLGMAFLVYIMNEKYLDSWIDSINKPTPTPEFTETKIQDLSEAELDSVIKDYDPGKTMIFDLRDTESFENEHLEYSNPLPYSEIEAGNFYLPTTSDYRIIFYTDSSIDQEQLQKYLSAKKVQAVQIISEPYTEWKSDLPTAKGKYRSEGTEEPELENVTPIPPQGEIIINEN